MNSAVAPSSTLSCPVTVTVNASSVIVPVALLLPSDTPVGCPDSSCSVSVNVSVSSANMSGIVSTTIVVMVSPAAIVTEPSCGTVPPRKSAGSVVPRSNTGVTATFLETFPESVTVNSAASPSSATASLISTVTGPPFAPMVVDASRSV